MTMIIINFCLLIVALILAITTHKQGKLLIKYDKCLKDKNKLRQFFSLVSLAKVYGHDIEINYSTVYDYYYILFYKNGWKKDEFATYAKICNSESFEEIIKDLERLIR